MDLQNSYLLDNVCACLPVVLQTHYRAKEAEDKKESMFDPKELLAVSVYTRITSDICFIGQFNLL